jgi:hypothetical protein
VNILSLKENITLINHSHLLLQHLEMIGQPLFHLILTPLMFRVQSPGLLIQPFMPQGFVSVDGSSEAKPISILRDTAAADGLRVCH